MVNVVENALNSQFDLNFFISFPKNINRKSARLFKNKSSIDLMNSQNNKLLEIYSLNIEHINHIIQKAFLGNDEALETLEELSNSALYKLRKAYKRKI